MAKINTKISKADELKAYKAAKTAKEMVESWGVKLGGKADIFHELYKVYEERAPADIIKGLIQDPEIRMMERDILAPKDKEICKLALAARFMNNPRVTAQVVAAKAEGATDIEIMDAVAISSYGAAKSRLSMMGMGVRAGFERAEMMGTKEKYEAAIKAGKEGIMSRAEHFAILDKHVEDLETGRKTPAEAMETAWLWLGMSPEDNVKEARAGEGPAKGFTIFEEKAPRIKMYNDMTLTNIRPGHDRTDNGTGLSNKLRQYLMWTLCAEDPCEGCLEAHVPFLYAAGSNEEEMVELVYLMCVECHKAELERIAPALAEGFRLADELGL